MINYTLSDLPAQERPRERLKSAGAEKLSSQELIAILLGKGIKGESVVITAQKLLSRFGNVEGLARSSLEELSEIRGIGLAKACQLKAAFELAKRAVLPVNSQKKYSKTIDLVEMIRPVLQDKLKEHFYLICLDKSLRFIKSVEISVETLDEGIVHSREVMREAIQALSPVIVLAHNHPSGNHEPSTDDIKTTKKLINAAKTLDIKIRDHIIIAQDRYFSFRDDGLLF